MNIASLLASKGSNVITIRSEQTVRQAVGLLSQHNIGALVVVDGAPRPVGILSERDIVRAAARNEHVFAEPVATLMTRNVVLGVPEDDLATVGHTMTERRIRHLPVMAGGRLVGIVSIGDVVKAQHDRLAMENQFMRNYIVS